MTTLNFIYPEQSDLRYTAMVFPDAQPHIKLDMQSVASIDRSQPMRILSRIANSNDLLLLLFAKQMLDHLEFTRIELHISYLLAARMDRVMLEGEPFSLKVVANILNSAGFRKVLIFDPHSEVSTALIDRSYAVSNHSFVKDSLADYFTRHTAPAHCLVSPDAGALKKIHKLAQQLDIDDVVECMKERDLKTGRLISFKTSEMDFAGKTCFIIDDICDGGGTFAGTARMLKDKDAGHIVLIVSHGIFSKGTSIEFVDEIYTTNSYRSVEGIHCFSISRYL